MEPISDPQGIRSTTFGVESSNLKLRPMCEVTEFIKMHHSEKVCVIGLGYVGLTLAVALAKVGYQVIGVESNPAIVNLTNDGTPHFAETGLSAQLSQVINSQNFFAVQDLKNHKPCGTYIITVGTPLNQNGIARLDMIEAATRQVADAMPDEALIILRSTVKIGTTRNVVSPILNESGKKFEIAMCPERTLEGNAMKELRELPQIVGADSECTRLSAATIFHKLTSSVIQVQGPEAAEAIKLIDNTYRDVQFAFSNEVARLCDAFNLNAFEIISAGKLGYSRTNVTLPGPVGGPCLEKDPHILLESAETKDIDLEITRASRLVNERLPSETAKTIKKELTDRGIEGKLQIAILGMAFKGIPETDDLRGSMSTKILEELRSLFPRANFTIFDPIIDVITLKDYFSNDLVCDNIWDAVRGSSLVVIANNHPKFRSIPPSAIFQLMQSNGIIYDYWNHHSNSIDRAFSNRYLALGNLRRNENA